MQPISIMLLQSFLGLIKHAFYSSLIIIGDSLFNTYVIMLGLER